MIRECVFSESAENHLWDPCLEVLGKCCRNVKSSHPGYWSLKAAGRTFNLHR